jgi:hypothetical protein
MSPFLNSLKDRLTAIEQEMQSLPGELDSVVARLDRGKLRNLSLTLDRDFDEAFNQYLSKLFAGQGGWAFGAPAVIELSPPCIRPITNEDVQRWRETYKSDVRVVIGKGRVRVMAACELAREYKTTVPQVVLIAQQQGYIVLGWDQHQKLLAEIGKLIGGDEESLPGTIVGIPVTTTDSPQEVKALSKNSSL